LSKQKATYITNLANAFGKGGNLEQYNDTQMMINLETEEIINLLTSVKGVGVWTAQMYLIFGLGRLEVTAAGDLGVRKGIKRMYKLSSVPTEKEVKNITCHWASLGTVGSFLAWRVIDQNLITEEVEKNKTQRTKKRNIKETMKSGKEKEKTNKRRKTSRVKKI